MAGKIAVEILGDSRSLERAFDRSSKSAQKFNSDVTKKTGKHTSAFAGFGKAIGFATGALGIGGLGEAVKTSFDEMADSQKVAAQTGAVIKSTGGAANVTAGQVDDLSASLLKKSGVDDEVIKSGENMLLTFTNIKNGAGKNNDIFNQATATTLDMATALGEDMPKAAMQVGKALNDPVRGMTALRRVGVTFTAQQVKQVKQMVKTGNTMGAQKLILKELNKEFGGSAKAAGQTLPGKLNILKETLKNLGGTIVTQLAPQITDIANKMINWLSDTKNQKKIVDGFKTAVNTLKNAVNFLKNAFKVLSDMVGGNKHAFEVLGGAFAAFKIVDKTTKVINFGNSFINLANNILGGGKGGKGAVGAAETLAGSLGGKGGLATAGEEAAGSIGGLSTALGPAVLGAGALAAGYALGTLIYQIPLVKQAADDAADAIAGLLGYKDPMKQFAGTAGPTGASMSAMVSYARGLQGTEAQKIAAVQAKFPYFATKDYQVAVSQAAKAPEVHITFNGVTDTSDLQRRINETIARHYGQRPQSRR